VLETPRSLARREGALWTPRSLAHPTHTKEPNLSLGKLIDKEQDGYQQWSFSGLLGSVAKAGRRYFPLHVGPHIARSVAGILRGLGFSHAAFTDDMKHAFSEVARYPPVS
jgi:hypothetical protein